MDALADLTGRNIDGRLRLPRAQRGVIRVGFVMHAMDVAGAEVLVEALIDRLRDRIEPVLFCLDRVGTIGARLSAAGVPVVCADRRPGWDLSTAALLCRAMSSGIVDVWHAHQYTPFFYTALGRIFAGPAGWRSPVIFTEHGRHDPDVVSPARRWVNRLVLDRQACAVTAVCRFSGDRVVARDGLGCGRLEVIPNGIDLSRYQGHAERRDEVLRGLGCDPGRRYLLHVARLHPVKDQVLLLEGFARVSNRVPDMDLLIAGDGPLRGELEGLALRLGISGRVKFLGVRKDVAVLLQVCDCFALTSKSEAASLTLMEAMASGIPIVVTSVGGNPELARPGRDALHVPRGDAAALADALYRLASDPGLARSLAMSSRERATALFGLDATVSAYGTLYRLCFEESHRA